MKFEQKASTPVNFSNTDTERVVLVTERLDPCQTAPRTIKTREFSHIRHRCMPECMRREEGPRPHTVQYYKGVAPSADAIGALHSQVSQVRRASKKPSGCASQRLTLTSSSSAWKKCA